MQKLSVHTKNTSGLTDLQLTECSGCCCFPAAPQQQFCPPGTSSWSRELSQLPWVPAGLRALLRELCSSWGCTYPTHCMGNLELVLWRICKIPSWWSEEDRECAGALWGKMKCKQRKASESLEGQSIIAWEWEKEKPEDSLADSVEDKGVKLSSRRENSLKKCVLRAWALVILDLYAKKEKKKRSFFRVFYLSSSKPKCFLLLFPSYSCVLKPSLLLLGFIKMHWVHFSPLKRYATFLLFLVWPPATKPVIRLNLRQGSVPASIPPRSSGTAQSSQGCSHQHGHFALCSGWVSQNCPEQASSLGTLMSCQSSWCESQPRLSGSRFGWICVPAARAWWCWIMSIGHCAMQGFRRATQFLIPFCSK